MADVPYYNKTTVTRHNWVVGDEDAVSSNARVLTDGIFFARQKMEELGLDSNSDDCFKWRSGEGAQIIIWVDVED
jgi:hypothetical protein